MKYGIEIDALLSVYLKTFSWNHNQIKAQYGCCVIKGKDGIWRAASSHCKHPDWRPCSTLVRRCPQTYKVYLFCTKDVVLDILNQTTQTIRRETKSHFGLIMKIFRLIWAIISSHNNVSNINESTFRGYDQLSAYWRSFPAHFSSTRELSVTFLLFKQGIHLSYF